MHLIKPHFVDSNTYHQLHSGPVYSGDYDDVLNRSGLASPTPSLRSKSRTYSAGSASGRASPIKGVDRTLKDLQDTLRDSESRRNLLMNKLKEAQDTIMVSG